MRGGREVEDDDEEDDGGVLQMMKGDEDGESKNSGTMNSTKEV